MNQMLAYTLTEFAKAIELPVSTNLCFIFGPEIPDIVLLFLLGFEGLFRPNRLIVIVCYALFSVYILFRRCEIVMLIHGVSLEITGGSMV